LILSEREEFLPVLFFYAGNHAGIKGKGIAAVCSKIYDG
jgi:hypothetical protein